MYPNEDGQDRVHRWVQAACKHGYSPSYVVVWMYRARKPRTRMVSTFG